MCSLRKVCLTLAILAMAAGPAFGLPRASSSSPALSSSSSSTPQAPGPVDFLPALPFAIGMGIKVKDTGTIAAKFKQRASGAANDYASGVQGAGADWENGAAAGESNYEQGVTEAIGRKAFGKGVRGAQGKYVENASSLGTQRYPQGIAKAEPAYARGVQPFLDTIKGINLPPRGPKGSPQNQQRADAVAKALRMKKVGG